MVATDPEGPAQAAAHLPPLPARHKVLTFELGSEIYGIDIACVQEVRSFERPTPLPHAPAWYLGVIDLRGMVAPIFDLRARLDLAANFAPRTVTVMLCLGGRMVGMVVDAVSDVVELDGAAIRPEPSGQRCGMVAVRGLAEIQDGARTRLLILLRAASLLHSFAAGENGAGALPTPADTSPGFPPLLTFPSGELPCV